jgi:hypothetical protein
MPTSSAVTNIEERWGTTHIFYVVALKQMIVGDGAAKLVALTRPPITGFDWYWSRGTHGGSEIAFRYRIDAEAFCTACPSKYLA